jgi:hypothetical protein
MRIKHIVSVPGYEACGVHYTPVLYIVVAGKFDDIIMRAEDDGPWARLYNNPPEPDHG